MNGGRLGEVFQERFSFIWKANITEHLSRDINFGSFNLVLELQPKICRSVVHIFLYDKGQSNAAFDIKTYLLNNQEKKEFEQQYKGSLKNGPTIWSMKRDELSEKEYTCASVKLGFEISSIAEMLGVEKNSSVGGFNFCNAAKCVEDVFKSWGINLEEKHLSSLERMSLDFSKLLDNEEGSNVVLKCVERRIKAHRCVLSARSDVFAAMFRSDMSESQKGIVTIENMDPETLEQMLRYIYSGKVEKLTVGTACELYKAVDQYGIESLKNSCTSFLTKSLSQISACEVLLLADTYSDEELEKSAVDFMVGNCAFLRTDQWNKFCEEHPSLGNKVYRKYAYKQAQCRGSEEKCIRSLSPISDIPQPINTFGGSEEKCIRSLSPISDIPQPINTFGGYCAFGALPIQPTRVTEGQAVQFNSTFEARPTNGLQAQPEQNTSMFGGQPLQATGGLKGRKTLNAVRNALVTTSESAEALEKMSLDFGKLFDNELESDVVLQCVDRQIKAHSCILSARSDVFATMLRNDTDNNKEVCTIKDVAPETLERMVRYIYSGKVEDLTMEKASELYKAAREYAILSLKRHCASFLKENLSQITACDVLLLADTYSDEQLEKSAVDFMVKDSELFCTDQWNKFCEEHPPLGIAVYKKYINMQPQSNKGLIFK